MTSIPELLHDHVTLEVECLDRLYLNGYMGRLATSGGLVTFMQQQLGKDWGARSSESRVSETPQASFFVTMRSKMSWTHEAFPQTKAS